ncbi:hypothetical protein BKA65DRAFT_228740 [Rhexocercosporidium sp. MPI-PUGE-AT-0058]|nr:hypothetical protein BKA65DRAFT_228740 [Rhexocercosporidium sp. MPI-PUGE-AT-0058]
MASPPPPHSGLEVAPDTKSYIYPNPNSNPPLSPQPQASHPSPYTSPPPAPYPYPYPYPPPSPQEKTICGVRRPTFWLALILIFVIIASGIGGGLGGSLAIRDIKRKCSNAGFNIDTGSDTNSNSNGDTRTITRTRTATTTTTEFSQPTSASTTDITVPTTGFLSLSCPSLTGTTLQAFSSTFRVTCGQDSPGPDIIAIVAYSLLDCARACAAYNTNLGTRGCVGATFNSNLAYVDAHKGTCWLKNRTGGAIVDGLDGVSADSYAQVVLQ